MRTYEDGEADALDVCGPSETGTLDYLSGYMEAQESEMNECVVKWWEAYHMMRKKDPALADRRFKALKEIIEQGE